MAAHLPIIVAILLLSGCSKDQPITIRKESLSGSSVLTINIGSQQPNVTMNLGEVASAYSGRKKLLLVNDSRAPVQLDRFSTSCECMQVEGLPVTIPPSGQKEIVVSTDLSHEANFMGKLAVEVQLYARQKVEGSVTIFASVR